MSAEGSQTPRLPENKSSNQETKWPLCGSPCRASPAYCFEGKLLDSWAGERAWSGRRCCVQQSDLGLSAMLDLIQLSMHSRDIEIVTTDHVSPYGVSITVLVLHTSGELQKMKWLDQDFRGRQGCSAVEMLHSTAPSYGARALYFFSLVALQLFFFKARKCGNWLAGELTQLQDVSCAGALVSPMSCKQLCQPEGPGAADAFSALRAQVLGAVPKLHGCRHEGEELGPFNTCKYNPLMSMAVTPAFVRLEMSPSGTFSLSYSPGHTWC